MAIVVFADGASSGNPGPGGWGAIVVDEAQQVQELAGGARNTTNNKMELTAVTEALRLIRIGGLKGTHVDVYTDSTYVIRGITQWIHGWKKKGWTTAEGKDVQNRDLWETLDSEIQKLRPRRVFWHFVPGHAGVHGNERADALAVLCARSAMENLGFEPQLYQGPLSGYHVEILNIPSKETLDRLLKERQEKEEKRPGSSQVALRAASSGRSAGAAYYLSLVGNSVARHSTWAECEARVKGASGARFKKVSSPDEERETLRSWGVPVPERD